MNINYLQWKPSRAVTLSLPLCQCWCEVRRREFFSAVARFDRFHPSLLACCHFGLGVWCSFYSFTNTLRPNTKSTLFSLYFAGGGCSVQHRAVVVDRNMYVPTSGSLEEIQFWRFLIHVKTSSMTIIIKMKFFFVLRDSLRFMSHQNDLCIFVVGKLWQN